MMWGRREHKAESRTMWMLLIATGLIVWYYASHSKLLIDITFALVIATTLLHIWARFSHSMEKQQYRKVRR